MNNENLDDVFGTTDSRSRIKDLRNDIRSEAEKTVSWQDALDKQQKQNLELNNEYRQIRNQEIYDRLQQEAARQNSIEKAIAATDPKTGQLSPYQLKLLNENRGIVSDGKNYADGQIISGGYIGDTGNYGFNIARVGQDGKVGIERRRFSRGDLYGMMSNRPDLFLPKDVEAAGLALQKADTSFVPEGRLASLAARYKAKIDRRNADMESVRNAMNLGNNRLEVEKAKQAGMNYRADNRVSMQEKILELRKQELEERTAKRLQAANTAEEKNKILAEAKKAELQLRNEELEAKYAQMMLQYGIGKVRDKAAKKVEDKLDDKPKEDGGGAGTPPPKPNPDTGGNGGDKATIKSGDNSKSVVSRKRMKSPNNGKLYERIVYSDGTVTTNEVK